MSDDNELERLRAENERLKAAVDGRQSAAAEKPHLKAEPPKTPSQSLGSGCLVAFILMAVLIGLVSLCSDGGSDTTASNTVAANSPAAQLVEEPTVVAEPKAQSAWAYSETEDPMGGVTKTTCVTSSEQVRLDFPYDDQAMRFCIRRSPKFGLDAYATLLSDGQILCNSYSRCHIRLRFDEGAAQSWSGGEASDGSSNIIFLESVSRLINSIKSSETMRLELEFYQNGIQAVTFDVRGLEW